MNTTYQNNKWPSLIAIGILVTIIVIVMLCSCNPCKRLAVRCPLQTKDSIVYRETISFDTVIEAIPADTTYIETAVPCDDFELRQENAKQKTTIRVLKGKLEAITICKEDSLIFVIRELQKELIDKKVEVRTVEVNKIITKPGKFAKFCIWYFVITGIVLILFVAYKIFKPKIPLINS